MWINILVDSELLISFYDAIEAFGQAESIPVSVPNEEYDPSRRRDAQYLKVDVLPVPPTAQSVSNGESLWVWLLQVSVIIRDDLGQIGASGIADKIRSAFPYNHIFNGTNHAFRVVRPATISPPIADAGWFSIPVTLRVHTVQ